MEHCLILLDSVPLFQTCNFKTECVCVCVICSLACSLLPTGLHYYRWERGSEAAGPTSHSVSHPKLTPPSPVCLWNHQETIPGALKPSQMCPSSSEHRTHLWRIAQCIIELYTLTMNIRFWILCINNSFYKTLQLRNSLVNVATW